MLMLVSMLKTNCLQRWSIRLKQMEAPSVGSRVMRVAMLSRYSVREDAMETGLFAREARAYVTSSPISDS